jgi:hypothetical protein
MARPSPIPLEAFERAVLADPQVCGMFYYGSLGRGTATRYSDLDIFVSFADGVVLPAHDHVRQLLSHLGEIRWAELAAGRAFVGPTWAQVDIEWHRRQDLEAATHYGFFAGGTIIKDVDGTLAEFLAGCIPEQIVETTDSAAAVIAETIGDLLYQARHTARGATWSAMGNSSQLCTITYELLGRLRGGIHTYGFRHVEMLLTPDEQALLRAAWPKAPTREENRRAALAIWEWTKHVWREAERVLGAPLGIELDEAAMLAAIEQTYT